MRLLPAVALALGLVSAQDALVDFDALGINPAEILASDPEVDAMLAEYEASVNSQPSSGLGRSSGLATFLSMFGSRQLPPGIELAQFIVNGQFDTIGFLNALKQALTAQAMASSQPATRAPPVTQQVVTQPAPSRPVASNRPVGTSSNDEFRNTNGGNRPTGNRPSASVSSSNSDLKVFTVGANDYNSCRNCDGQTALECFNSNNLISCGSSANDPADTTVCQYTIRQRYGKQPLFYTQCVERHSCMAQARQNFVARSDGDHPMNRCKGTRLINSPRFRPTSQCAFCMRMTKAASDDDNKLFLQNGNIFTDSNGGTNTVTVTTALESPWSFFASSNSSPYGQVFDLTQYV